MHWVSKVVEAVVEAAGRRVDTKYICHIVPGLDFSNLVYLYRPRADHGLNPGGDQRII